jgi:dTDP-4-amino-4,6-dideoxygalactose transaminase
MQVPLLDLQAQYATIRDEILQAVTRVCDSQQFILGPDVDLLETELAKTLQVEHAIGVSSGTDALLAALMALGVGPGDEVVTTTYSFFATAGCVARVGAKPVFVDIDPDTYNIDPSQVASAFTSRTKAIVPVHLFGLSADLDPLIDLADEHGLPIIEDACQAIGGRYRGRQIGGIGTVGCFSFFPSKNLGGAGDGGLITTNDAAIAERVRLLRRHGAHTQYRHQLIGGNFRLDTIQAAVLRVKLPYLTEWTAARRRNAARYETLFRQSGLLDEAVSTPVEPSGFFHVYNQYVVRVPKRDALREFLQSRGIGTAIYYPVPFHAQECFGYLNYREGGFPCAEAAAQETLALPVSPDLTEAQQSHVVESIAEFVRSVPASVLAKKQ